MRPRSTSLSITAPESTPRISSTSRRPTGWRYAMMASVSSAAGDSRRGRSANCARSIVSPYSRRVRNCHPSAISTSSTPWSSSYAATSSASDARTALSPAPGSSEASSSSVSGRDAANSAASSSFVRECTRDHHRAERFGLGQRERAALRELEKGDKRRQHVHQRRLRTPDRVPPAERLALREQRQDPRRRPFDVERTRDDAMQHRLRDQRYHALGRREQVVQIDLQRRGRRIGRPRFVPAAKSLRARIGGVAKPVDELADLLVLEQPAHQLGTRVFPLVVAEPARQQHLRLDAQQPRRHLEIVGGLVEPQVLDDREELIRNLRDREVGDVDLVFLDQMQQQVERAGEFLQLDDEAGAGLLAHARPAHGSGSPFGSATGTIMTRARWRSWNAGHKKN